MARETCQLCKRRRSPASVAEHHIVPIELTAGGGIPESQLLRRCADCHDEVHNWYAAKVHHKEYDLGERRFRDKSSLEMVQEYQIAFSSFVNYKQASRKSVGKSSRA